MSADFDKSGVELEGFTGNAEIQFTQTEYLRVSDFATVKNDLDLYIKFIPYGIGSLTQILGDITITNEYSPATEAYDFPLRYGERWASRQPHPRNGLVKAITSHRFRHQKQIPTQRHGKSPILDSP